MIEKVRNIHVWQQSEARSSIQMKTDTNESASWRMTIKNKTEKSELMNANENKQK